MKTMEHIKLLGMEVEDRVTGFNGVVSSVAFDLYGCIQAVITPKAGELGKMEDGRWFDVARLRVVGSAPVMDVPDFAAGPAADGRKGPAEKPQGCW